MAAAGRRGPRASVWTAAERRGGGRRGGQPSGLARDGDTVAELLDRDFEFALDLLVAGIEAMVGRERVSRRPPAAPGSPPSPPDPTSPASPG